MMGLSHAHKGYEYQDLLSGFFILENLLKDIDGIVKIDKKESNNDKFDDLTIITPFKITKRQIKYSDDKVLVKADFSSASYDLALDTLFKSWKETSTLNRPELIICLAWEYLDNKDELDFLKVINSENIYDDNNVKFLKFDIEKIWEEGKLPTSTWRRLRDKSENIIRDEFIDFLNDVTIETNLPKSSNDIANPASLEVLVFSKLRAFGVGKYPNHQKSVGDVLLNLTHIIKNARSNGDEIRLNEIVYKLGLRSDFGNIAQNINIDNDLNVINESKYNHFNEFVFSNGKTMLLGEPGAGKSWFIQNYLKYIKKQNIKVIQHYCYTGLDDIYEKERITINVFLANLISDIVTSFPELASNKNTKYGVDKEELQLLLNNITEDTILIIDGLDHIGRIYNFHRTIIKQVETEIIQVLSRLNFPENVHVILASQPVSEVVNLNNQGYETFHIEPWSRDEVDNLLLNFNVKNPSLDSDYYLSDILVRKSNGNPLYLTYLINEIKSAAPSFLSIDFFEKFPPYNNNLSNYYDYLLSNSESHKVPQVLAGAPFHLTEKDLIEITHLGKYVKESIESIRSILKLNISNGGYAIYHESFRRYILEILEKQEVDVERLIYHDLIDWLKRKGFYEDRRSYSNLLILLFESKRYEEILFYCNKEFVVDSVFYGNNVISLKNNYNILIKTSCIKKDYGALIVCTELGNMIYSLEYSFDENSELYYEGLGLINGFSSLKETLSYEGQLVLNIKEGLKLCYLCSRNNFIPHWEPYINELINSKNNGRNYNEEMELYKYYICACIDLGWDMVERLSKITSEKLDDYSYIVFEEYRRRDDLNELNFIINKIEDKEYWIKSLAEYLEGTEIDCGSINQSFEYLKEADSHSENTKNALELYIKNIDTITQYYYEELDAFLESINSRNWFFNWIRFIAEVSRTINDLENEEFEVKLISAYNWLTNDTEPFKGNPRTCDLYNYESFIYATIKKPLKHIKSKGTWNIILRTVDIMSNETSTVLQGSTGGPLPTFRFLNLLMEIANVENNEVVLEIISEKITKENNYRLYTYLADYSFKHAIILAKANKYELSKKEFKQGVLFLLSYSSRKDRTLSHLFDSVLTTFEIDNVVGRRNVERLKPLADAVVFHTDGKSTKTYQREWFELLISTNIELAITYLRKELVQRVNHWIVEDSLEELLIRCNSSIYPQIENALLKTFSTNSSQNFIEAFVRNIEWLLENKLTATARRSLMELASRIDSEDRMELINIDLINTLQKLYKYFGVEWNKKIQLKKNNSVYTSSNHQKSLVNRKGFMALSYGEFLEYINNYGIRNEDIQGVYYYLSLKLQRGLDEENKNFIRGLVYTCFEKRSINSSNNRLLEIIDNLRLSNDIMAYFYMQIFLEYTDGWYHRFTELRFFKQAHEYDSCVAEDAFFNYIYNHLNTADYSFAVGGQIINSLAAINYDDLLVLEYWDKLFDIIDFRLSGQIDYDWEPIKEQAENFEIEEKMISLLLTRLKYGEANRFKWVKCELNYLLEDKIFREKFSKPFIQFLEEKDEYIDYALIFLLVLVKNHYKFNELVENKVSYALEKIYPTSDALTNYLIRSIIHKSDVKVYCQYNRKHQIYNENVNFLIKRLNHIDTRTALIESYGIDTKKAVHEYTSVVTNEIFVEPHREILYNRIYHTIKPNVYFYDVLTRQYAAEVENYLRAYVGTPFLGDIEDEIFDVVIDDIPLIMAQHSSIIPRPQNIVHPEFVKQGVEEVTVTDWIRIGYYEKWFNKLEKYKENFGINKNALTIISGIGFAGTDLFIPFIKLENEFIFHQETDDDFFIPGSIKKLKAVLTTNLSLYDDTYLTYNIKQFIGVCDDVMQYLGLRMLDTGSGIVWFSKEGEEVMKYTRWEVSYVDDSDKLPYLIGSQLLMRKKEFERLCDSVQGKPLLYITKLE